MSEFSVLEEPPIRFPEGLLNNQVNKMNKSKEAEDKVNRIYSKFV